MASIRGQIFFRHVFSSIPPTKEHATFSFGYIFKNIKHHSKCSKWVMTRTSSSFQTFFITFGLAPKWALHRWWNTDVFRDEELRFMIAVPIFSISFSTSMKDTIAVVYCRVGIIQRIKGYFIDLHKLVQACASPGKYMQVCASMCKYVQVSASLHKLAQVCPNAVYSNYMIKW